MKISSYRRDNALIILLSGELDHNSARPVMRAIDELLDEEIPKRCALDFSGVSFMDSSGIAVIIRALRHMTNLGGLQFWLENCEGQALRVLDAAGIGKVIQICVKQGG